MSTIGISTFSKTTKLFKNQNATVSIIGEYISSSSKLGLKEKPYATSRVLYLVISICLLCFLSKYTFISDKFDILGVCTVGPKASHLAREVIST